MKKDADDSVLQETPAKPEPHIENHIAIELFDICENFSHNTVHTDGEDAASVNYLGVVGASQSGKAAWR